MRLKHYNGDVEKDLASYNWGSGNLDALLARNPNNWKRDLPRETRDYISGAPQINLNVTVHGHSVTVTGSQLGAR